MTDGPPLVTASPMPKVIWWFRIYAGFLCFLYLAVAAFSLVFFLVPPGDADMSVLEARVLGVLFLILGLALFGACLLPFLVKPRPWLWTYDLVLICLGMTSACILPASIPLLIYWLKPEAKAYFGKT